ncbi:PREDICTED: uncharacterized protein LOC106813674 isoform X5 [Priapulus caudatus]|nr:PREDICTED: uncharacterized protein LOC106813674 isoform X5 [Priapulus caudatus]
MLDQTSRQTKPHSGPITFIDRSLDPDRARETPKPPYDFKGAMELGRYTYVFEHGATGHYTAQRDVVPSTVTTYADQSELFAYRIWEEFFSVLRFPVDFIVIFFIELIKFLCRHIFQRLLVGVVTVLCDYAFKPLLAGLFNGLLQPTLVLAWNVVVSLRRVFEPLTDILHSLVAQVVLLLRAVRLIEWNSCPDPGKHRVVVSV